VGGAHTTGGTRTGALGTFVYASPEAMERPQDAGPPADVYSLGMTAVFCYHGRDLPAKVMRDAAKVIRGLSCSAGVKAALERATEWEVEDRFSDVGMFCEALRACAGEPARDAARAIAAVPSRAAASRVAERDELGEHVLWGKGEALSWAAELGEDRFGRFATFRVGEVAQRMRRIPPGRFLMGSPEWEAGRSDNEGPQHEVELRRGFWLAETPCTQALWQAVMGRNRSHFVSPDRPVETVSWEDCQAFLAKLNALVPGLAVRLPSEAEWEVACRGGTSTATWAGDLDLRGERNAPVLEAIAWYSGNSGWGFELTNGYDSSEWSEKQYAHTRTGTRPVRERLANPYGLHDMLGNVNEWCADWYGPYTAERAVDPVGPAAGSGRVFRGGSWYDSARRVRAACRYVSNPERRGDSLGFRLARGQD